MVKKKVNERNQVKVDSKALKAVEVEENGCLAT